MNEQDIFRILNILKDKALTQEFIWRLEGSANLAIQGIKVDVNDVDITTDKKGYSLFKTALKEYVVEERYIDSKKEQSLLCRINNFEVEIVRYDDSKLNFFDKIVKTKWKNLTLNILPLEYAEEFYALIGKTKKAELIKDHLSNRHIKYQ